MVSKDIKKEDSDSLITLPRSVLRKFVDEAYEQGRRDALKEKHSKTHKTADIDGMAYKANIVFDEDEEDERKSEKADTKHSKT